MQVSKWGNSLAVRLPARLVEQLGLKEGDEIELRPVDKAAFEVELKVSAGNALQRLRKFRGRLPEGFKFDRDDANSRESD